MPDVLEDVLLLLHAAAAAAAPSPAPFAATSPLVVLAASVDVTCAPLALMPLAAALRLCRRRNRRSSFVRWLFILGDGVRRTSYMGDEWLGRWLFFGDGDGGRRVSHIAAGATPASCYTAWPQYSRSRKQANFDKTFALRYMRVLVRFVVQRSSRQTQSQKNDTNRLPSPKDSRVTLTVKQ